MTAEVQKAERLLEFAKEDGLTAQVPAKLLTAAAERFAQSSSEDLYASYTSMRSALEDASAHGQTSGLSHLADQGFEDVFKHVDQKNADGDLQAALDEYEKVIFEVGKEGLQKFEEQERTKQLQIELYDGAIAQARLQNDSKAAALLVLRKLRAAAPPEGLFNAVVSESRDLTEKYLASSKEFVERLCFHLSEDNLKRAKGEVKPVATANHGYSFLALARLENAFEEALKARKFAENAIRLCGKKTPLRYMAYAFRVFAEAETEIHLRSEKKDFDKAIKGAKKAVVYFKRVKDTDPEDFPETHLVLGTALVEQGTIKNNITLISEGISNFENAVETSTELSGQALLTIKDKASKGVALAKSRIAKIGRSQAHIDDAMAEHQKIAAALGANDKYGQAQAFLNLAEIAVMDAETSQNPEKIKQAEDNLKRARDLFERLLATRKQAECDQLHAKLTALKA